MRPTLPDGGAKRRRLTRAFCAIRRAWKSGVRLSAFSVTAICILAVTGVAAAQAPGDVLKIVAVTPEPPGAGNPAAGMVSVDLLNVGDKTITAYRLGLAGDHGSLGGKEFFGTIGMESFFAENAHLSAEFNIGGLRPGEKTRHTTGYGGVKLPLTVEVAAVVFADDSAIGDETAITDLFAERKAEAAELSKWCAALRSAEFLAGLHANPVSALRGLAEQVRAAGKADSRQNTPAQLIRDGLASPLEQWTSALEQGRLQDPSKIMEYLLGRCACIPHAVRKCGAR
jgi:hypothetical protein